MNKLEKVLLVLSLAAIVLASPYLIAKYKAFNYAHGQSMLPETPLSTPSPEPNKNSEEQNISPDGKATLTLKKVESKTETTYTLTTNNGLYFSKTVGQDENLTIPFNAWSPDDKYLFIKDSKSRVDNYLVFNASGSTFNGEASLNVTDFFNQKLSDFNLGEITGWASDTLLIVNTNNKDGSQGPSFWFELPSKSFIRLSDRFN